jgi:dTDP-4-amino-4,6-dideoxygalactose transaminase
MTTDNEVRSPVPLAYPRGEAQALRSEIAQAVMRVIDGNVYILGTEVAAFEKALAASVGAAEAIGVASGTDALVLAMLGIGIEPGDEVITVSHTAGPTVAAIRMVGAVPVLVDIEEATYCLDPATMRAALSSKTKAIIAVHLYGHPANIAAIRAAAPGIPVIEDCAQAQGALSGGKPVGGLGDAACFSFYPTKNLGAIGDGGAVTSNNLIIADRVRKLRTYGWTRPQYAELEGGRCSRLDEIQAALLSVKLKALPDHIERRRAIAALYRSGLAGLQLTLPSEGPGDSHAYHLFVLRSDQRDALEAHLQKEDIGTGRHYPLPVHMQPGLAAQARVPSHLVVTERVGNEILSLPMFATMTDSQVDRVIAAVKAFFA